MATQRFSKAFGEYIPAILRAREEKRHHDYRRHLFTTLIRDAFEVDAEELQLEEHVTGLRVRGFIDLLYQYLVFEFKRDIEEEREDGLRELRTYLKSVEKRRPLGVLTDGLRFEVYSLEEGELRLIDTEDLMKITDDPVAAYLWFEAYLFSARDVQPTPGDIVRRFGSGSAVFAASRTTLRLMLRATTGDPTVQVKYSEWDRLLAKVYGTRVGAEELFIRHTYLALLVRVIAYIAAVERRPRGDEILGVVDGSSFQRIATNLAEADFFSWVLDDAVRGQARNVLNGMVAHLGQYDLDLLGEQDLLQRLYQDLVDPTDRHDLGEYYTPDWLAELALREAGFAGRKSILDPACGSGTFLFTAIRMLAEDDAGDGDLARWCLDNVMGVDVHPVAVLTSKVNYLLALKKFAKLDDGLGPVTIPVYMADSLLSPEARTGLVPVPVSDEESFHIRADMAAMASFDSVIDTMAGYARMTDLPEADAAAGFREWLERQGMNGTIPFWAANLRLMRKLIQEGRDTIWAFILKNAYRPFYLAQRRFDFIAGNPPWLSYRYIRDRGYQAQVKRMTLACGLLTRGQGKLFTQMDTATLFFSHCREWYMKNGGTIAFVMPRSVITGAKQHAGFQASQALTRVLDLKDVDVPSERSLKVFGVDTCVLIADANATVGPIPATRFAGVLREKGLSYGSAMALLHCDEVAGSVAAAPCPISPYREEFLQGATIVPRTMWFAIPASLGINPLQPRLMTDPGVAVRANEPWRDVHVECNVEAEFIYATLLSNDLVPFGTRQLSLVVLPLHKMGHKARCGVIDSRTAYSRGYPGLGSWLSQAEAIWNERKKDTTQASLVEWLDYHGKLSSQDPLAEHRVFYNRSGSHLCSSVLQASVAPVLQSVGTQGLVADSGTYCCCCATEQEAHFLSAVLNAPCVNITIKPHQTRGAYHGERDIHRRPFEVLPTPIPTFNPANPVQTHLAELSVKCHQLVAASELPPNAEIGRLRQKVRADLARELAEIDAIVAEMLGLQSGRND